MDSLDINIQNHLFRENKRIENKRFLLFHKRNNQNITETIDHKQYIEENRMFLFYKLLLIVSFFLFCTYFCTMENIYLSLYATMFFNQRTSNVHSDKIIALQWTAYLWVSIQVFTNSHIFPWTLEIIIK